MRQCSIGVGVQELMNVFYAIECRHDNAAKVSWHPISQDNTYRQLHEIRIKRTYTYPAAVADSLL